MLSAGSALQPRGDRGVNVLRACVGTLAPQPLPQHGLPYLVEIEGDTEPISDLGPGHHHILLSPLESICASAKSTPRPVWAALSCRDRCDL